MHRDLEKPEIFSQYEICLTSGTGFCNTTRAPYTTFQKRLWCITTRPHMILLTPFKSLKVPGTSELGQLQTYFKVSKCKTIYLGNRNCATQKMCLTQISQLNPPTPSLPPVNSPNKQNLLK
jgi:hypothetical protein